MLVTLDGFLSQVFILNLSMNRLLMVLRINIISDLIVAHYHACPAGWQTATPLHDPETPNMQFTAKAWQALVLALAFFSFSKAQAQDEPGQAPVAKPELEIEEVMVFGTRQARYKATKSGTATGVEALLLDTARSIQIIPEQLILDQQSQELRDILKNSSGVQRRSSNGGTIDTFILRGFAVRNVLQDGFQVGHNTSRMQTENIERVEVVKGPTAILYGQSQPGGVINVVTKRPKAESERRFFTSFDEFGLKRAMFDTTGEASDNHKLLYRLVLAAEETETFRKTDRKAKKSRRLIAPSLQWSPTERIALTANIEYTSSELPMDGGLVGIVDDNGVGNIVDLDRSVRLGEAQDLRDSKQYTAGLHLRWQLNEQWWLESRAIYQHNDVVSFQHRPVLLVDNTTLLRLQQEFQPKTDRTMGSIRLSRDFDLGLSDHSVVLGVDYNQREFQSATNTNQREFQNATNTALPPVTFDLGNPVYGQSPRNVQPVSEFDRTAEQTSAYIQDVITFQQSWILTLGARIDRYKADGLSYNFVSGSQDRSLQEKDEDEVSPNAGLLYKVTKQLSLFASYSESFDPNQPSENLVTGEVETVDPSEGQQIELGIKGSFLDEALFFNLAYYDITRTNIPFLTEPLTGVALVNGEEQSKGIELDTSIQFANGLNLTFNYAHIDAEVTEGEREGNTPINVPKNAANLWLTYEFTEGNLQGLGLGGGAQYNGDRYADGNNTFELEEHTTYNLTVFYYLPVTSASQVRLQIGVNNLSDEEYYTPNGLLRLGVGQPRTVYGSIGYEF